MNRARWFLHPIFVFIVSIIALGTSLFLYIYWYMAASTGLSIIVNRFNLDEGQVFAPQTWIVILVLSLLVGFILLGIFTIFAYSQKASQLYRLQHNFINNFTHELRTPVTSLKLFLETILKHEFDIEERHKYLRYMIQDVGTLTFTIDRILDLAKLESRSYHADLAPENLVRVVKAFYEKNQATFRKCDIEIIDPPEMSLSYDIDRSLFEMMLMNLTTNALKYNYSSKPTIRIEFKIGFRDIRISFKDNGIGIDKTEIKKIFKKFYQVGHADNRSAIGSGLGLHLVQNIARIHKGRVVAESLGRGKGSVFTLILPCAK